MNGITLLCVALGGGCGAIARGLFSVLWNRSFPGTLPYGTLTANLIGSLLLGWLWGAYEAGEVYGLLGIGFLGAFTTFSTWILELERLREARYPWRLMIYLCISWLGGLALAWIGYLLA